MDKHVNFIVTFNYDSDATDPDALEEALFTLLETAMDTPGILDNHGNPDLSGPDGSLQAMLEEPDTDDAHFVLRQVYEHMGLKVPDFVKVG